MWGHIRHSTYCSLTALNSLTESTHFYQCIVHFFVSASHLSAPKMYVQDSYICTYVDINKLIHIDSSAQVANRMKPIQYEHIQKETTAFKPNYFLNPHSLSRNPKKWRLHQTLHPLVAAPRLSLSLPGSTRVSIRPSSRRVTTTRAYSPTPATERVISIASYALPFLNSLQYGRFLFAQYPRLGLLVEPIFPTLNLYRSVPYASFVAFFGLYLGVVRNTSFSRYVRFNAMQAVTLDVLLTRILDPGQGGVWGHTGVFVFSFMCFIYGVLSCLVGKTPYIPFVAEADAAGRQL